MACVNKVRVSANEGNGLANCSLVKISSTFFSSSRNDSWKASRIKTISFISHINLGNEWLGTECILKICKTKTQQNLWNLQNYLLKQISAWVINWKIVIMQNLLFLRWWHFYRMPKFWISLQGLTGLTLQQFFRKKVFFM